MMTDRGRFVLDVNPRLGGGYPFSHLAGANLPAALIAWADGIEPDAEWLRYRPGVLSSKYDGVMVVDRTTPMEQASARNECFRTPQYREINSSLGSIR